MKKKKLYLQRQKRALKKIVGKNLCPRLAVFRSHKHIYGQLIDDETGRTLAFSSTLEKAIQEKISINSEKSSTATKQAAFLVGEHIAKKALEKSINLIVFDRGRRAYHGRIGSLAEGARKAGLIF